MATLGAAIGSAALAYAPQVIGAAVNYGGAAIGGHVGIKNMQNAHNEIQNQGEQGFGVVGKVAGDILGKAIAGQGVDFAQQQQGIVQNAVVVIGNEALNAIANKDKIQQESGAARACRIVGALGAAAVPVAVAVGVAPAAPIILTALAVKKLPEIVNALRTPANSGQKKEFVKDILVPVAKDFAIKGAGEVVEGVVIYNEVMGAYDARIVAGEQIGRAATCFLPKTVQDLAGKVGRVAAQVDAGRYALSDGVVGQAKQDGAFVKDVVDLGLNTAHLAVQQNLSKQGGYINTAKNVAIVAGGILGGAALVALAPEVAALTGGMALISVAPSAITWIKQQLTTEDNGKESDLEDDFVVINDQKAASPTQIVEQEKVAASGGLGEGKTVVLALDE